MIDQIKEMGADQQLALRIERTITTCRCGECHKQEVAYPLFHCAADVANGALIDCLLRDNPASDRWHAQLYASALKLDPPLNVLVAASVTLPAAVEIIRALLKGEGAYEQVDVGRLVHTTGRHQRSALMVGCVMDAPFSVLELLLAAKSDPNHKDLAGYSALHWMVDKSFPLETAQLDAQGPKYRASAVELLLKNGANVNATGFCKGPLCDAECKRECQKTPLHFALETSKNDGLLEVCDVLMRNDARLDTVDQARKGGDDSLIQLCKIQRHPRFGLRLMKRCYRTDHEWVGRRVANFDSANDNGWWGDGTIVAWLDDEDGQPGFVNEHDVSSDWHWEDGEEMSENETRERMNRWQVRQVELKKEEERQKEIEKKKRGKKGRKK